MNFHNWIYYPSFQKYNAAKVSFFIHFAGLRNRRKCKCEMNRNYELFANFRSFIIFCSDRTYRRQQGTGDVRKKKALTFKYGLVKIIFRTFDQSVARRFIHFQRHFEIKNYMPFIQCTKFVMKEIPLDPHIFSINTH